MTPCERYRADLAGPDFVDDPAQAEAVGRLQDLHDRLIAAGAPAVGARGLWRRLRGERPDPVRGLYLWGGVGRGKTYVMDTFFDCLPFADKRRLHFHRFMREAHAALKAYREHENPLDLIAAEWAEGSRVLCFDELFVSDIADAMILAGLLEGLFSRGVCLVATSNIPPRELYREGLQRERFRPAITLIRRHTEVLELDGDTDYRLRFLEQAGIYHTPLDARADAVLAGNFEHLCPGNHTAPMELIVEGRPIPARRLGDGVAWFDFDAICDGPRSQVDYIEIARQFHTVLVSGIPVFAREHENQARRFISLVDEFYDRGVKLIVSAAAPPDALYRGARLGFEFERTASRLIEMQSQEYLAAAHRP